MIILFTLMMRALSSYGTSVLTRATRGNIPEDGILQQLLHFGDQRLDDKAYPRDETAGC
jgi:hypothetical protein